MPILLIIIGAIFVIAGIKNNGALLMKTVGEDFSGAGSFWYWIVSVVVVGSIGHYQPAKNVANLFLFLIVLVFILSNGGVYAKFTNAIANPVAAPANSGTGASAGAATASTVESPLDALKQGPMAFSNYIGNGARDAVTTFLGSIF